MSSSTEAKETNIHVVVRVRPRNQKEIKENSPVYISCHPKQKEVHVRQGPADVSTKVYTFDRVFGPEASQEDVFDDVVRPMLDEVLTGYNCTIFAYGQTGTGKTYTMEGNLEDAGKEAGIIPRTLYKLFDALESDKNSEFSVKVSCLELYNEELKDLLSVDEDSRKLRIFEDLNRKGSIVIQNLEEVQVRNVADVIGTLQRGSIKRQIAATKMNEASSRSHCIFSITVHIKEATPDGEELLKVGKLNLVDLAGSENIGRSGAENKRAKEAGMINQSLLTLGRVINALVDRSPHIPYRESKLTRLLQDSLGGRTKTCIIAAVSPAKCNLEETFSTLEYAHRAKNIRNKPEINQKMTKRALIREYVSEIERLKADLSATREKNGVYMSTESYNSLMEETEGRKTRIEEINRAIAAKEEQIQILEEKYKSNVELLATTKCKLTETLSELSQKTDELKRAFEELNALKIALEEQEILTSAHQETEKALDRVAANLLTALKTSQEESGNLFRKVERHQEIESRNFHSFNDLKEALDNDLGLLKSSLREIQSKTNESVGSVKRDLSNFLSGIQKAQEIGEMELKQLTNTLGDMFDKLEKEAGFLTSFSNSYRESVDHLSESILQNINSAIEKLVSELGNIMNGMRFEITKLESNISVQTNQLESKVVESFEKYSHFIAKHSDYMEESRKSLKDSQDNELRVLRDQNKQLKHLLEAEKQKNVHLHKKIKNNFESMMQEMENSVENSLETISCFADQSMSETCQRIESFAEMNEKKHREFALLIEKENQVVDGLKATIANEFGFSRQILSEILPLVINQSENVDKSTQETKVAIKEKNEVFNEKMKDLSSKSKRNYSELSLDLQEMNAATQKVQMLKEEYQRISEMFIENTNSRSRERIETFVGEVHDTETKITEFGKNIKSHTMESEDQIHEIVERVKQTEMAKDPGTGKTPKRLDCRALPTWKLTESHEEILRQSRENKKGGQENNLKAAVEEKDVLLQSKLPRMRALRDLNE